jgi:nitric oxide reductase NorD protein
MEDSSEPKSSLTGLASKLSKLPADKRRVAVEASAALAGVSLRVSRDFVEMVPEAALVLSAEDLREWGELGRRLAMGSAATGSNFFAHGVAGVARVPAAARSLLFQICTRQLVLSSSISLETFQTVPGLVDEIGDDQLAADILKLAADISQRSAKHSSDFLKNTGPVARQIARYGRSKTKVSVALIKLASAFANRTGGMTADLWANLPKAISGLSAKQASALAERSTDFLEHGGTVTLHFVSAGGEVLRHEDIVFNAWCELAEKVSAGGNAVLIAFLRSTPKFFNQISGLKLDGAEGGKIKAAAVKTVLHVIGDIAEIDPESALAAFRSSAIALRTVTLDQFENWINAGLADLQEDSPKARRSYFALETRHSNDRLRQTRSGLHLDSVQHVLRLYVEALTSREVEIAPLSAMPQESRIGDGTTIYLPATIAEFDTEEMDFRLYKVLAAYGAGQIEFGTFATDTNELRAAYTDLGSLYSATAAQLDAFSLSGYLDGFNDRAPNDKRSYDLPRGSDYRAVLSVFPEPRLARKIFTTMENARIDSALRTAYRGLRRDLDMMQALLRKNRPFIFDVPYHQVPFELLFQITLCGGATDDARRFYGQIVDEIEGVIEKHLLQTAKRSESPTVADSLFATSRVYNLFQNIAPEQSSDDDAGEENGEDERDHSHDDQHSDESVTEDQIKREERPQTLQDLRDLFNAWNDEDEDADPDDLQGNESWGQCEIPEQPLESGEESFAYDEWDRELNDYRVGWSRVIEKKVRRGDRTFVELARSRYRGVISSIRHQFQLMKPENLTRVNREFDGEDYDLNALVDFVIDRRADGMQSENIYTKRLRKQRDVAVSLLLDQSSSTARTITRNPLQPYTYPGRRIIEIEKEGLVLMSEALEAVGDVYSINGFTSEGRRNVKFYVVKDFDEKYSEEIENRIGGITFQNNTRLGAAIRHAAHKLLGQENRTKLLIILTDGRPYDHDYGDARYAREDVREALIEAKTHGITPFCITVDRESEAELRDLYGDVGYTIIDDVLSLPERMPNIYRRLTS